MITECGLGAYGGLRSDRPPKESDDQSRRKRRNGCDHFRGEDPYDQERREFLNQKMIELCAGTDEELSRLKSKYRNDKRVVSKLNEYEPQIESR